MALPNPKPFSIQSPDTLIEISGGNKQKLMQMVQAGTVDQTSALLAAMKIDKIRAAAQMEQAPQQTVMQKAFAPPAPPAPPAGLGAIAPQGGGMPAPQGMQMAQAAPSSQAPVGMAAGGMAELPESNDPYNTNAGGGLTTLPIPDDMYDEHSFAGGGIVAFSSGGESADMRRQAKRRAEMYYGRSISDKEFDLLLRATHAEASGKSNPEEQAMIMGTVLNRAKASGKTIQDVLYAPNQFQSVTGTAANKRAPSKEFKAGPSETRANSIFNATALLSRVPSEQVNFTSASPSAYGPGTNIGYLDKLREQGGTRIAGTVFNTSLAPTRTQVARAEPPLPNISAPRAPRAEAPAFTVADTPSLGDQALRVASALNPINPAYAAEAPGDAPRAKTKGGADDYYLPSEEALLPQLWESIKGAGRTVGEGLGALSQGMGAAEYNQAAIAANVLPALAGGKTMPLQTMPIPSGAGAPNAPPPAAPPTAARDTTPIGQNYGGRYIMGSDPEAEARLLGRTLPPKKSPEDERFDAFMARMGDLPKYPGMSDEERAQQRAQDRNEALFLAAMQGLSKGSTTFTGALGDTGAAYAQAAMASNKEQKALDREQREIAYKQDLEKYKIRGEAAKYALGIGESAEENFLRRYAKASPEERKVMEAGMAARSPYGNLGALLQQNKVAIEDIDRKISTLKSTKLALLAPEGIVTEAQRNEAIRRLQQMRSDIASGGGGLGGSGSGGGNVVNVPWG
jgi:hypothetical protein